MHEQQKAAITVRCAEDIETSLKFLEDQLEKNAESSDKVGNKIFWLNVVLAIATLVGAIATVVMQSKHKTLRLGHVNARRLAWRFKSF